MKNPLTAFHTVGSSPLARGLRLRAAGFSPKTRIIPARAGFTLPISALGIVQDNPDHPRSRGVYAGEEEY